MILVQMANSCTHKALYKKWTFEPQLNNWLPGENCTLTYYRLTRLIQNDKVGRVKVAFESKDLRLDDQTEEIS
jgi:hypothetical protein